MMRLHGALLLAGAMALGAFAVRQPIALQSRLPQATLQGDEAHPAHGSGWMDTRLYFGLGPAGVPARGVSEAAWRDFLDHEVTPRFPAGLSVVDVYGQWQGKGQTNLAKLERIRSKMIILLYPSTAENAAKIDAIRVVWKQRTGDQSVLKVSHTDADVSF